MLKKINYLFLDLIVEVMENRYGKFEDFTISDWKNDLIDILDNITKGPQIIVGSSLGGWLMMLAAKSRKNKVCGLLGLAAATDFGTICIRIYHKNLKKKFRKKDLQKLKVMISHIF